MNSIKKYFTTALSSAAFLSASLTATDELTIKMFTEPSFEKPVSQMATAAQFYSPDFAFWCSELKEPWRTHRKLWEFCYVMEVMKEFGILQPGKSGLGFGVGQEPLPALFAKYGCKVLASDQDFNTAARQGWSQSGQHANSKISLNSRHICDQTQFDQLVDLVAIDMNHIPANLEGHYDFVWSCCSLEHLGSIGAGAEFIKRSAKCLKPGGVAVHTTEFNLSSLTDTVATGQTVIYRRYDIIHLALELISMGFEVRTLNLFPGNGALDHHIDVPPYSSDTHIKLRLGKYASTSIGLVIYRPL